MNSSFLSQVMTEQDKSIHRWSTELVPKDVPILDQLMRIFGEDTMRQLGIYPLPPGFKLSVVMPVYNEKATIYEILHRVRAVPIPKEIMIVDDCSTDGTRDLLHKMESEPDVHIFYHERNYGKGAALQTAFNHVTGDVVIIQDADLEYHPSEYRRLIQPIVD